MFYHIPSNFHSDDNRQVNEERERSLSTDMVAEQDDNRSWTIDTITSYNARDFFSRTLLIVLTSLLFGECYGVNFCIWGQIL